MGLKFLIQAILHLVTVAGALGVLFNRDTVRAAMSLVVVMIALAAQYFLLGQEFVGAMQIIVYAGAIMVLFLFVITLLNMREAEVSPWYLRTNREWGAILALIMFFVSTFAILLFAALPQQGKTAPAPDVTELATLMMTKYCLPFILTSVLLLVAVIGAVVMARRFDPDTGEEIEPDADEQPSPTSVEA